jgi:dihydrofolate synthase/folylpolyglutamate synthase
VHAIAVPGHDCHAPAAIAEAAAALGLAAATAPDLAAALAAIAREPAPVVLVMGSLYLAGAALAANDQRPS